MKHWLAVLLLALVVPVAAAAKLTVTGVTLGSGVGAPPLCDSGQPTLTQNVGTLLNGTNIVSVDVSGIVSACGGGTIKLTLNNGSGAEEEATKAIPAGGGTVNVGLSTPVPLEDSHFVAVTLQGP